MPQAHCMKCKKKVEMANVREEKMKTGKDILKGECPTCGSKVNTFPAKKKEVKAEEKPVEQPAVVAEVKPKRKYVRKPKPAPDVAAPAVAEAAPVAEVKPKRKYTRKPKPAAVEPAAAPEPVQA